MFNQSVFKGCLVGQGEQMVIWTSNDEMVILAAQTISNDVDLCGFERVYEF